MTSKSIYPSAIARKPIARVFSVSRVSCVAGSSKSTLYGLLFLLLAQCTVFGQAETLLPGDCLTLTMEPGKQAGLVVFTRTLSATDTVFEMLVLGKTFAAAPPLAFFAIDSVWGQRKAHLLNASKEDRMQLLTGNYDFVAKGHYRDELESIKITTKNLRQLWPAVSLRGQLSIKLNVPVPIANSKEVTSLEEAIAHLNGFEQSSPWIVGVSRALPIKLTLNEILAKEGEPIRGLPPLDFNLFVEQGHPNFTKMDLSAASWDTKEPYSVFGTTTKRQLAEDFLAWKKGNPETSLLAFITEMGLKRQIGLAYLLHAADDYVTANNTAFLNLDQEILTVVFTQLFDEGKVDLILLKVAAASAERLITFKKYYDDMDIYPGFFHPEKMAEISSHYLAIINILQAEDSEK